MPVALALALVLAAPVRPPPAHLPPVAAGTSVLEIDGVQMPKACTFKDGGPPDAHGRLAKQRRDLPRALITCPSKLHALINWSKHKKEKKSVSVIQINVKGEESGRTNYFEMQPMAYDETGSVAELALQYKSKQTK